MVEEESGYEEENKDETESIEGWQARRCRLNFKVKDTGQGIKQEDFEKLFKVFQKLEDRSKLNESGCGLGLTICKRIVE
jgi:signal transduction histidine kinase